MKKLLFIFLFSVFSVAVWAQDFLITPRANPSLFKQAKGALALKGSIAENRLKTTATDDSVIYRFDTLNLPFRDDFSRNHLLNPFSPSRTPHTDTTVYRIRIGGSVYRDTMGLVIDSTFTYQIAQDCTIIQRTPNVENIAELYDISSYPSTVQLIEVYQPFNVYDTINGGSDTLPAQATLFQDSAKYYFVNADSTIFYTDRDVLRNNTFPILPPSIGVVTFDGLDQNGLPYDLDNPTRTVEADHLTSLPIRMGNLLDTNVYISFFVQPKGISINGPEAEDSLVLEFYNPSTGDWSKIWGSPGYVSDTFQQVIEKVPNAFLKDGTQFRFRAYANASGAFDQWHLDYIYLNAGRDTNDIYSRDIAYVYPPGSFLKEFHAMPYWHFQDNPAQYMFDSSGQVLVKNNYDDGFNVFNKVVIPDTVNGGNYYRYPAGSEVSILAGNEYITFDYPINFDFQPNEIDSAGTLKAVYDIRYIASQPSQADIIPSNDTAYSTALLDNYYAYDDGTAEAGYGVNPNIGTDGTSRYLAVEFNQPFTDTIGGMQIYFLPQSFDVRSQRIRLKVWVPSQSGGPGDLIFSKEDTYNPMYTDDNGFITLWFDSLIEVDQRYYIGYESVGMYSLNIGYDLNTNSRNRIFWSFNGANWSSPSTGIRDGSLMIRPIYRKSEWGVGLKEKIAENLEWLVYPNPANDEIYIELPNNFDLAQTQLIDLSGRILWQSSNPSQRKVDLYSYPQGIYILRIVDKKGVAAHKKIIISHE